MTKSRSSSISSSDLPGGSRSSSISVVPDALENGASNVKDAMGGGVDNVQDAAANAQAACTNCCTCQCCAQTDQDARRADGASRGGSKGGNPFDQAMRDGQKNRARRGSHSSASSHSHSSHSFDAPNGCCGIPIACCCCACCMAAGAGAGSKVAPTPASRAGPASSGRSGNLFDDGSVITLKHVGSGEYVQVNSSDDIDAKSGGCDWERAHWRVHTDDGGRTVRLENVDHDGFYIRTNKQGDELDPQGNPGGPRGLWVVGEHDGYTTFKSEMFGDEQKYYMGFNGKGEKKAPEDTGKGVHGQFEVAFAPER